MERINRYVPVALERPPKLHRPPTRATEHRAGPRDGAIMAIRKAPGHAARNFRPLLVLAAGLSELVRAHRNRVCHADLVRAARNVPRLLRHVRNLRQGADPLPVLWTATANELADIMADCVAASVVAQPWGAGEVRRQAVGAPTEGQEEEGQEEGRQEEGEEEAGVSQHPVTHIPHQSHHIQYCIRYNLYRYTHA